MRFSVNAGQNFFSLDRFIYLYNLILVGLDRVFKDCRLIGLVLGRRVILWVQRDDFAMISFVGARVKVRVYCYQKDNDGHEEASFNPRLVV